MLLAQTLPESEMLAGLDVHSSTTHALSPAESPSAPPQALSNTDIETHPKYPLSSTLSASAPVFEPCAFFIVGACTIGDICAFDHSLTIDDMEDMSWDPSYPDVQDDYEDEEGWYDPATRPNELCKYYLQGSCEKGWECEFLHDEPPSQSTHPLHWETLSDSYAYGYGDEGEDGHLHDQQAPICKYFLQDKCIMGDKCIYRHEHPSPDELSTTRRDDEKSNDAWKQAYEAQSWGDVRKSEPPKPERVHQRGRICRFYSQGGCKKGDLCTFSHIQSAAEAHITDDNQPTTDTKNEDAATWDAPWDLKRGGNLANTTSSGANAGWTNDEGGGSFSWADDIEKTESFDDTSPVVDTDTWSDAATGPTPWDLPADDTNTAGSSAIPSKSSSPDDGWGENADRTVPPSSVEEPEAPSAMPSTSTASDGGWGESADWGAPASLPVEQIDTNDDGWPPADEPNPWSSSDSPPKAKGKGKETANEASEKKGKTCRDFLQGNCKKGKTCRFLHAGSGPSQRTTTPLPCFQFSKGECKRGDACRFLHERPKPAQKKDTASTRPCSWFLQGSCKKGNACDFLHENPGPVQEGSTSGPSQKKNTPKPCVYFSRGNCKDRNACRNLHEKPSTQKKETPQVCVYFSRGHCMNGVACLNIHIPPETSLTPSERLAESDSIQQPFIMAKPIDEERRLRADEATWSTPWPTKPPSSPSPRRIDEPCKAYGQGHCRFGDNCIYLHLPPPGPPEQTATRVSLFKPLFHLVLHLYRHPPHTVRAQRQSPK